MNKLTNRLKSDKAASNTVEVIILIALAIFLVISLYTGVMSPISKTSEGISSIIDDFPVTFP